MRKILKLLFILMFCILSVGYVEANAAQRATGTCGDNLTWEFEDGILTISGEGEMPEYDVASKYPWSLNYKYKIETVEIEEGVTTVADYAFYEYSHLAKVILPDGITEIGEYSFGKCESLSEITIPDSMEKIGGHAFCECTALTKMLLPDGITEIGTAAFDGCENLTEIKLPKGINIIPTHLLSNCTNLKEVTIPDGITEIGGWAFWECSNLENVDLPDSLKTIRNGAFCSCIKLKSIDLKNIESIGSESFRYCESLTSVSLKNAKELGNYAFYKCWLTDVVLSESIEVVPDSCFALNNIEEIIIPNGVVTIEDDAFYRNNEDGESSIIIPSSVKEIGAYVIYNSITDIYYSGSQEDWNSISIDIMNPGLSNAVIHFNSTGIYGVSIVPILEDIYPDSDGITITWSLPEEIDTVMGKISSYNILRKTGDSAYEKIGSRSALKTCEYTDTNVVLGETYTYTVQAVYQEEVSRHDKKGLTATYTGEAMKITIPVLQEVTNDYGGLTIHWLRRLDTANDAGNGFYILRKAEGGDFEKIATIWNINQTSYTDRTVEDGQTYTYTVQAFFKDRISEYDTTGLSLKRDVKTAFTKNEIEDITIKLANQLGMDDLEIEKYWLTTGVGGMKITLFLKKALDTSEFNGTIAFSHLDTLLETISAEDVVYDRSNQSLAFSLILSDVKHLAPDTSYTISVKDQYGNVLADITKKSVSDKYQFWGFVNQSDIYAYSLEDLKRYYPENMAEALYSLDKTHGKDGVCFGMSLAAASWIQGDMKGTGIQGHGILNTVTSADTPLTGPWEGKTVADYIKACHILQNSAEYQEQKRAHFNDYHGLFSELKSGNLVVISMWGKDLSSHAVLAYDFTYNSECINIDIFDPQNKPHQPCKMIVYEDYWTYQRNGVTFDSRNYENPDKDMYYSYRVPTISPDSEFHVDSILMDIGKTVIHEISDNISGKFGESGDISVIPIYHEDGTSSEYAWVKGNGSLDLDDLQESVKLIGENVSCTISGEHAAINFSNKQVQKVKVTGEEELEIIHTYDTEYGSVTITISGTSQDGISVQTMGDSIVVDNMDEGEILVEYENGDSWVNEVENGDAVLISADGNTEPSVKPYENLQFEDVTESDYYYKSVLWAVNRKITAGLTPTIFAPNAPCTRGQIVTFLWRTMGSPDPVSNENPFLDVSKSVYYYKAVLWAVENRITAGLTENYFGPEQTCTRSQVVTFLWRVKGSSKVTDSTCVFADVRKDAYYYNAMLWAVKNKITAGLNATTFAPESECTRGQIVTFLYRTYN